jgi:hypothetical protein
VPTGYKPTRITKPIQHFYPQQSNMKPNFSCPFEPNIKYSLLGNGLPRGLTLSICVINVAYELFSFCRSGGGHKTQSIGPTTQSGGPLAFLRWYENVFLAVCSLSVRLQSLAQEIALLVRKPEVTCSSSGWKSIHPGWGLPFLKERKVVSFKRTYLASYHVLSHSPFVTTQ